MPYYDYLCVSCGSFTETRPMAESALPRPCPHCAAASPRAILTAPRMTTLSRERRAGFEVNERSAHAPKVASRHAPGCACCAGAKYASAADAKTARQPPVKSFPGARPWMISH